MGVREGYGLRYVCFVVWSCGPIQFSTHSCISFCFCEQDVDRIDRCHFTVATLAPSDVTGLSSAALPVRLGEGELCKRESFVFFFYVVLSARDPNCFLRYCSSENILIYDRLHHFMLYVFYFLGVSVAVFCLSSGRSFCFSHPHDTETVSHGFRRKLSSPCANYILLSGR